MTTPTPAAVDAYLKQLQKALAQGDATEHTHRPALKLLLEASAANIKATNEPKSAERANRRLSTPSRDASVGSRERA